MCHNMNLNISPRSVRNSAHSARETSGPSVLFRAALLPPRPVAGRGSHERLGRMKKGRRQEGGWALCGHHARAVSKRDQSLERTAKDIADETYDQNKQEPHSEMFTVDVRSPDAAPTSASAARTPTIMAVAAVGALGRSGKAVIKNTSNSSKSSNYSNTLVIVVIVTGSNNSSSR